MTVHANISSTRLRFATYTLAGHRPHIIHGSIHAAIVTEPDDSLMASKPALATRKKFSPSCFDRTCAPLPSHLERYQTSPPSKSFPALQPCISSPPPPPPSFPLVHPQVVVGSNAGAPQAIVTANPTVSLYTRVAITTVLTLRQLHLATRNSCPSPCLQHSLLAWCHTVLLSSAVSGLDLQLTLGLSRLV